MATIDVVVNPQTGQPVERVFLSPQEALAMYGVETSDPFQLPDRAPGSWDASQLTTMSTQVYSSVSDAPDYEIPPEVQQLLGAGVDPFASLGGTSSPTGGTAQPVQTLLPAGSGGMSGLPGLAPAVTMPTLAYSVQPPPGGAGSPQMSLPEWMASGRLGAVFFSTVRNRQITGVRFGSLPMVVMRGGRGGV